MRLNRYTSWLLPFGIALLASCGGGSSSSGNSSTSSSAMQVSIDAMTAVPVINGSSTRGTLYIHNYGTQTATGLNFGLNNATTNSKIKSALSNLGLHLNGVLLNQNGFALLNPERCTAIPAGGSCAINFSTPELAVGDRGNSLVTLSYKINGHNATTNQVVNYQYVSLSALSGVNFTAGSLNVSGAQGNTRHVVGYLYGGGSTGSKYQNVNLVSNSLATNISNGFINGQEVVSGQVIPVEFAVTLQNDKNSGVNVIPQWGGISQANVANKTTLGTPSGGSGGALSLYLIPAQNTVNYIFGDISVLAAPTVTPVVINVTNNGNADGSGNLTATSDNNALTIDDSNCVSTALLANAVNSCTISFSVPGYTSGSATVTFKNSTDQTVGTQIVIWTNNMPVPAVYITPNQSSITFGKGVATPDNSTVFTLNNVGKAPLNTATYTPTNTGPATWMQDGTTCGSTIAPQGTCTISGHFVGTNDGTGTLYYQALGSYNSTNYSFVALPLRYEVTAAPSLTITPIGISLTLLANGVDVKTQTFNVINQGSDPALFSALSLLESNTQVKPTISGGTCSDSTTLAETESCSVIVSYGPAAESNTANESGIAIVNLNYHGGTPDMTYNVQDNFNYNLVGNDTTVVVGGPTATIPGNGEESNPFRGNPSLEPMQITLTYTNPSVNYGLTNFNLNTNNLPYGLVVDPSSTCTTGSAVMNLAKGQSCNLVLKVDRDLLTTSASVGSVVLNYTSPTATWTTPMGFYSQTGSMVYMNYLQPSIAFTLSSNNANFESTILSMTAANESTTTTLTANISGVRNWLESVPVNPSSNCSINNSDYSVSCNLKTTTTASVTYIMPNYLQVGESANIPLVFSTGAGEYAYLNPEYTFINYLTTFVLNNSLGITESNGYIYIAQQDSAIVKCSANNGMLSNCVTYTPNQFNNAFGSPIGVEMYGDKLFVANSNLTNITACQIGDLGNMSSCNFPASATNMSNPIKYIAFSNDNYAYITARPPQGACKLGQVCTSPRLYACNVNGGNLQNCSTYLSDLAGASFNSVSGVALVNNYIYIANSDNTISRCSVSGTSLTNCSNIANSSINNTLSQPNGMAVLSAATPYLFIANSANNSIARCAVDLNGNLTSCTSFDNTSLPGINLNSPQDITIANGYIYISNYAGHSVSSCVISSSGDLSNCTTNTF